MSPRESRKRRNARAAEIYELLIAEHPDAKCALVHSSPFELAVATILSAQCTDARVNKVTPELFRRYPGPAEMAAARPEELEEAIRSTGFFRNKARSLLQMSAALVADHGGEVPRTMEELTALPGIGRKTANVILGNAFGIDLGVVVDTHVKRLSRRMGLTSASTPVKIERELMEIFPRRQWTMLAHLLIWHGRRHCKARTPLCHQCPVSHLCPSSSV
ncbi:MAG: endonuclease III [Gemmatimonadetes bacterium]|nr:endonuclease III [Gemmatimonadota bacterium]MCY3943957.1 endonuclease III [Gemmatimonadota bacterium]